MRAKSLNYPRQLNIELYSIKIISKYKFFPFLNLAFMATIFMQSWF